MKILLAVDGSACSLAAVEEAARTPWPEGSVVRIVSVAEIPLPATAWTMPLPVGAYEQWERSFEERADANIWQALARFGELAGAQTEALTRVLKGDPKVALLDEAERWGADLIIVGTHGYNALQRLWLGSVSRAVTTYAKCSVQVARSKQTQAAGRGPLKILLAVDGSEYSNAAVEEVAARPWPRGSATHVISAIHLPFAPTPETWALPDSYYAQLEKMGREQAETAVNSALAILRKSNAARDEPLTLTSEITIGHPEETIIETAQTWGADLIAVGSHGRHGLTRFLLGSVSQAIAAHAPCSVEIVRRADEKEA